VDPALVELWAEDGRGVGSLRQHDDVVADVGLGTPALLREPRLAEAVGALRRVRLVQLGTAEESASGARIVGDARDRRHRAFRGERGPAELKRRDRLPESL